MSTQVDLTNKCTHINSKYVIIYIRLKLLTAPLKGHFQKVFYANHITHLSMLPVRIRCGAPPEAVWAHFTSSLVLDPPPQKPSLSNSLNP